jgi:hypothetical protein
VSSDPQLEERIVGYLKAHSIGAAWQISGEVYGTPFDRDSVAYVERVLEEMVREGKLEMLPAGGTPAYILS